MGLRLILALVLPLAVALYILHFNRFTVAFHIAKDVVISDIPVVILIFLSALAGAFFASLLGWTETGIAGLSRQRERRAARRRVRARSVFSRAEALRSRGKIRAARRKARKAARLDPALSPAFGLAGDLAAEAGDLEEALRCSERLHSLSPDSLEALVRLSSNLEDANRTGEAEKLLSRLGESGAVHPDIIRRLRDMFAGQERWEKALAASRKLSSSWASVSQRAADERAEGDILMAAGEEKIALSDGKAAAELLEEAVRRMPEESGPRLRLGDAHLLAGRSKRAVKTWEEGYRRLGATEFLHRVVAQYGLDGDEKEKRQAAQAMLSCGRLREEDPVPMVMAAALLFDAGRGEEARKWLEAATEKAVGLSREDSWVGVVLGLLDARGKLEAGDRLAAESALQKVVQEACRKVLGEPEFGRLIRSAKASG
ncbi:MAG: hypothetical protein QF787_02685 [Nitrospinota bacterium]|jgi:tetratricopeptide (TPR) repeat protein|nr:hypothetical protein [Nitrospinota bacterium]